MLTATEWYHEARESPSDIVEHLDTFVALVEELDARNVIELGVRSGNSTAAWLHALEGRGGHLWSVDIVSPTRWVGVFPHWTFLLGDDISLDVLDRLPPIVDIVFIDTSHEYAHTLAELIEYVPRVRSGGRVVLHDPEVEAPDNVGGAVPFPVKKAIRDYCDPLGLDWTNDERCFGLGVITIP